MNVLNICNEIIAEDNIAEAKCDGLLLPRYCVSLHITLELKYNIHKEVGVTRIKNFHFTFLQSLLTFSLHICIFLEGSLHFIFKNNRPNTKITEEVMPEQDIENKIPVSYYSYELTYLTS